MTTKAQEDFIDSLITSRKIAEITPNQIEVLDAMDLEIRDEHDPLMAEKPSQLGRFALQGATFGFADEIEAMAKSLMDSDVDYTVARNEIRQKMAEYAKDNGGKALAAEFAGAVPGTILAIFGGPTTWAASLANMAKLGKSVFNAGKSTRSIVNTANRSGLATAAYTVGANEKEMFGEDANLGGYVEDAASGYGIGATLGGTIAGLAKPVSKWVVMGIDKLRGGTDGMSKAVRKELQRMVTKTGLTEEQIIQKVADGEIIAENATLKEWIKQTMKLADSGVPQKTLMDTMTGHPNKAAILDKSGNIIEEAQTYKPSRSKITRDELKDTMQESLGRGSGDENLMKLHLLDDIEFRNIERAKYATVFGKNNRELDKATTQQVLRTIENFADGADDINAMFRANGNIVPFYKVQKNGSIKLIRQPTVQDAEIIYRSIRDKTDELYRSGKGNLGKAFQDIQDDLKAQLDIYSPELAAVRLDAYHLRVARDGYTYGQKLLNQKPEDLALMLERHKDVPNFMQSLRDGFLVTLKNRDSAATFRKIADDRTNLQKMILDIFPEDDVDKIINKANIATQANAAQGYLSGQAGAQTNPMTMAAQDIVQNSAIAGGGDIGAVVRPLMKMANDASIPEAQAMEIVALITETNPDLVREALIDASAMNKLQMLMDGFITKFVGEVGGINTAKIKGTDITQHVEPATGVMDWTQGLLDQFVNMGAR
jgi:hypothetical protein